MLNDFKYHNGQSKPISEKELVNLLCLYRCQNFEISKFFSRHNSFTPNASSCDCKIVAEISTYILYIFIVEGPFSVLLGKLQYSVCWHCANEANVFLLYAPYVSTATNIYNAR